jgi:DNA-binding CsgD family transcriptional regulator
MSLLAPLTALLDALTRSPHPDAAAAALVDGPGSLFDARSAAVLVARPPQLVVVGLHGYPHAEVAGLESIPVDGDFPLCRSYREGEPIIDETDHVAERYEGSRRPGTRWQLVRDRLPGGTTVSAPIMVGGRAVGAYSLSCASAQPWSTLHTAVLHAAGAALGLWLTHPDAGLPPDSVDGELPPTLTDRQRTILALVAAGSTNLAIAGQLGLSESTVKQELRRVLAALRVSTRTAAVDRATALGLLDVARDGAR